MRKSNDISAPAERDNTITSSFGGSIPVFGELTVFEIILNFLKLAIPTIISCFFLFFLFTINAVFAGRLNNAVKLAAAGLGQSWLNVMCFHILVGTNGAQETLTSQAFGAGKLRLCGVYLNRGRMINTAIFIGSVIILCFSKQILGWLG